MSAATPQRILVPVDFSQSSTAALHAGAHFARRFDAALTVLHVEVATPIMADVLDSAKVSADVEEAMRRHLEGVGARLESFARETLGDDVHAETVVVDSIFIADAIVRYAQEHGSDWISMGGTGHRAIARLVLGNTAAEVVRRSDVPVLTVHAPAEEAAASALDESRRILVAVDLGEGSSRLLELGAQLAANGGELTLLHVVDSFAERKFYGASGTVPAEDSRGPVEWSTSGLGELLSGLAEGIEARVRVVLGRPAAGILEVEHELRPDVTIVGTHGRHGLKRFALGSVAERIVRRAIGPVLTVRNAGHATS